MKVLSAAVLSGMLLCLHAGLVQSAGAPDPVFRTGFENFTCPNGILEDGEQCDDNLSAAGDGCSAKCQVESGYQCSGTPSACATVCGDQVIAGPESCDQGAGNVDNGDGCDSTCQIEHGYNCQGPPPSNCFATCGDGFIGSPVETCDQGFGFNADGDGCSSACQVESGFECTGEPSVCVPK